MSQVYDYVIVGSGFGGSVSAMLEAIVRSHLARYPDMQIQDLYKLIHQAVMGSGHAVSDPDAARL